MTNTIISFENQSPLPIKIKPKYKIKIWNPFFIFDQPSGTIAMFLLPNDGITAKEQRQLLSQHK